MRVPTMVRLGLVGMVGAAVAGCGTQPPAAEAPPAETPESASSADVWKDHTQGLPFVIGYQKGLQQAQAEGKPAMMFVTTTWCGWCKKLAEEDFNDPGVRELLSHFVCVIVDGDVERDVQSQFGTEGYPHIVFLSAAGEKIGECKGYRPVDQFKPIVEEALAKAQGAS